MSEKKSRQEAIEELTLMLMYLTRFPDEYSGFREITWKGYDHDALEKLSRDGLITLPKGKVSYFLQEGSEAARKLLKEYNIADFDFFERYELRQIKADEVKEAAGIEAICFPPKEACTYEIMAERVKVAPDCFLVAIDKEKGKMAGFIDGLCSDEWFLKDEIFTDPSLHDPDGRNVMICGLDVLPEYRRQGIAGELMYEFLRMQQAAGRKTAILTCVPAKVKMYKKMGFTDRGLSDSSWGGEKWHEMDHVLNI